MRSKRLEDTAALDRGGYSESISVLPVPGGRTGSDRGSPFPKRKTLLCGATATSRDPRRFQLGSRYI